MIILLCLLWLVTMQPPYWLPALGVALIAQGVVWAAPLVSEWYAMREPGHDTKTRWDD
jgi:hypothetical protein